MFSTLTEKEVAALSQFRTEFALMLTAVSEDGDVLPTEDLAAIVLEVTVSVLSTRRISPLPSLLSLASKSPALLLAEMCGLSSATDLVSAFCAYAREFVGEPLPLRLAA